MTNRDPRQVINTDDLAGKTIDRVAKITDAGEIAELGIIFTDGSFLFIDIESGYEGDRWLDLEEIPCYFDRVEMGIASPGEIEEANREKKESRKRQAALEASKRRSLYRELKAEFESKGED